MLRRSMIRSAGGLMATAGIIGTVSGANTITVEPGENIQDAVNNADDGDKIKLKPGDYIGQRVVIDKQIAIVGEPGDTEEPGPGDNVPVLDGDGKAENAFIIPTGISDVIIEGVEIRNYAFDDGQGGRGVIAGESTSNVTVQYNYVHDMGWTPIVGASRGEQVHDNWSVNYNVVEGYPTSGIRFANCQNSEITNNKMVGSTGYEGKGTEGSKDFPYPGNAILVEGKRIEDVTSKVSVNSIQVQDNSIVGPFGYGVQLHAWNANEEDAPVELRDVTISGNDITETSVGMTLVSSLEALLTDVKIRDNAVTQIENSGIFTGVLREPASHGQITITGNEIRDTGFGVALGKMSSGTVDVSQNEIRENENGIGKTSDHESDGTFVSTNNIVGNTSLGVLNFGGEALDATDNWWGHANGPGGEDGRTNPAGKIIGRGDKIEGNIDFDPWRRKSVDT